MCLEGIFNYQKPKIYLNLHFFFFFFLKERKLSCPASPSTPARLSSMPTSLVSGIVLFYIVQGLLLSLELANQIHLFYKSP